MSRRIVGWRDLIVLAAALFAVVYALDTGSSFWLYNLTMVAIFAIAAVGLNLILGLAGQVSFAQTTFMAVGGYGTAKLTTTAGFDPWLGILIPAVAAALVGVVVGLSLLRLRGHYLAMATFALALATNSLATGAVGLTGGATGISAIPPLSIGSTLFDEPTDFLVITWIALALSLLVFLVLSRSHVGRAWRALAKGPDVAASLGVRVRRLKIEAFVISAVMGSVAGSLYAQFDTFIAPDFFDLAVIINIFLMVFVGGRGSFAGPVLGAAVVVLVPQAFTGLGEWQNVAFFALLLLFMIFVPSGILGTDRAELAGLIPSGLWRRMRRPRPQGEMGEA